MSTGAGGSAKAEWRRSWPVVLAAMLGYAASTVTTYSGGLFIEPLQNEFSWSRAQVMSGHSIAAVAGVVCAPFTGLFVDRFGPRRLGIAAVLAICLATALLSLATAEIWTWRLLWLPMAFAIVLIQPSVWTAAVTSVFAAGRGLALAVMLCGGSLASIITPRLTYILIEEFGWRAAFVWLATFWAVLALPLIWLCFSSAKDRARMASGPQPAVAKGERGSIRESGILTIRYAQLLVAGVCIAAVVVTLVVSLVPILSANGLSRAQAVDIVWLVGVSAILGRLTIGMLLDRWSGRFLAAIAVSIPIVGILILIQFPGSVAAASVAVLIFGLSFGAELDILAYLTSRYFAVAHFGLLFGTIGGFIGLASGNGPLVVSAVFDATQSYLPALWGMIPLCIVSAVLFLLLGPYPALADDARPALPSQD